MKWEQKHGYEICGAVGVNIEEASCNTGLNMLNLPIYSAKFQDFLSIKAQVRQ